MSHYQSYKNSSQIKKYPSDYPSHYLNKKRAEHEMDPSVKKRYEYDDKYDRFDKYDKYNQQSKYGMGYPNSYNSTKNTNYRIKDYHYPNKPYRGSNYSNNKSPRKDYKKPYPKYSTENEGVRNLSHCEIPSPPKKKDICQDQKDGYLSSSGFNSLMRNIPSQQGPYQQQTYQRIYQNQQNINISIISNKPINLDPSQCEKHVMSSTVNSTTILNGNSLNKRRFSSSNSVDPTLSRDRDRDKRDSDKAKNFNKSSYKESDSNSLNSPEKKFKSNILKPKNKVALPVFNKKDVHLPDNPYEKSSVKLPILEYSVLSTNRNYSTNSFGSGMPLEPSVTPVSSENVSGCGSTFDILGEGVMNFTPKNNAELKPSYLLSKIPNTKLVSHFVDPSLLNEEKYDKIPPSKDTNKFFLVYDEKYEEAIEQYTSPNILERNRLEGEREALELNIDKLEHEIRKCQYKIQEKEWKVQQLNSKTAGLDTSFTERMEIES